MRGYIALLVLSGALLWLVPDAVAVPMPPLVNVHQGQCPGYEDDPEILGCAYDDGTGDIYVRPGAGPATYWHEVGHQFDYQILTEAHRNEFRRLARPWEAEPAEIFADAFMTCAMQDTGRERFGITWWHSGRPVQVQPDGYGYDVSWRRHQRICQLIWNAAGLSFDRRWR